MRTKTTLTHDSHGFSPIIGIIAIVVVIGLAFGGWFVLSNNKDDSTKKSNSSSQQADSQKDEEKDDTQAVTDPSEGGKYLVIKEWGVRFPLSNDLRGDIGTYVTSNSVKTGIVLFESKKLNNLLGDGSCDITPAQDRSQGSGLSVQLTRLNPSDTGISAEFFEKTNQLIATIGEYRYYQAKSNDREVPCTDASEASGQVLVDASALQVETAVKLNQSLKSIELIPSN